MAALVNGANVATQINAYDEYGVPQAGFSGRFGYAGAMFLERGVAATWHMRNRQYHPGLGRFMQTDPIGYAGGMNLYAYVGGDPVNRVDPWGLCAAVFPGVDCVDDIVVTGPLSRGGGRHSGPMGGGVVNVQENVGQVDVVDEVVVTGECNWWCRLQRWFHMENERSRNQEFLSVRVPGFEAINYSDLYGDCGREYVCAVLPIDGLGRLGQIRGLNRSIRAWLGRNYRRIRTPHGFVFTSRDGLRQFRIDFSQQRGRFRGHMPTLKRD